MFLPLGSNKSKDGHDYIYKPRVSKLLRFYAVNSIFIHIRRRDFDKFLYGKTGEWTRAFTAYDSVIILLRNEIRYKTIEFVNTR